MAVGLFLLTLRTGEGNLVSINNDNEITRIHMWCKGGLVLSAKQRRGVTGEPSENNIGGVNYVPGANDFTGFGTICAHGALPYFLVGTRTLHLPVGRPYWAPSRASRLQQTQRGQRIPVHSSGHRIPPDQGCISPRKTKKTTTDAVAGTLATL